MKKICLLLFILFACFQADMLASQDMVDALVKAIQGGNFVAVKSMIDGGKVDVNTKNKKDKEKTPLHYAIEHAKISESLGILHKEYQQHPDKNTDLKVIQYLLSKGAGVNTQDTDKNAPLHYAAKKVLFNTSQYLAYKGADPVLKGEGTLAPYRLAARFAQGGRTAEFLKHELYKMVLINAIKKKNDAEIEYVIPKSFSVDFLMNNGSTPLILAVDGGDKKIVEAVLKKGADINYRDSAGNTALYMAAMFGKKPIIKLLIEKDADCNVSNMAGQSPLSFPTKKYILDIAAQKEGKKKKYSRKRYDRFLQAIDRGDLSEVKKIAGKKKFDINKRFANKKQRFIMLF